MKLVRIHFTDDKQLYFFDRIYDTEKSDEENCDLALQFMASTMEAHKVMAVMRERLNADKPLPSLINFNLTNAITITEISVYDTEKQEEKQ